MQVTGRLHSMLYSITPSVDSSSLLIIFIFVFNMLLANIRYRAFALPLSQNMLLGLYTLPHATLSPAAILLFFNSPYSTCTHSFSSSIRLCQS